MAGGRAGRGWHSTTVPRCLCAIDGPRGRIARLMAMLSDVRREEREACATEVRRELVEAERQGERMAAKRLGWALKHIRVRGDQ